MSAEGFELVLEVETMVDNRAVNRKLTSHFAQYNDYNMHPKIEELYSGLLRNVILQKICDESITEFPLSEIPEKVHECFPSKPIILRGKDQSEGTYVIFSFTIVDPSKHEESDSLKVIKSLFFLNEQCQTEPSTTIINNNNSNNNNEGKSRCNARNKLKVIVKNSTHLIASWEEAFKY